ncbi:MAG: hypothetical protein JWO36_4477 [Myxococcales bacterium]|nr:hypothetical protein [Myxococcales bacterium]
MRIELAIVCILMSSAARAGDRESPASRHLVYFELLGKAGEYGVGYEYTLMPWLAVGGAASFAVVGDQQIATGAPYIHLTPLRHHDHAMYFELGAILAHSRIPSPVSDWKGMSNTGSGGFLSLGYEHTSRHLVFRASGSAVAGAGGLGPMVGISIGARP